MFHSVIFNARIVAARCKTCLTQYPVTCYLLNIMQQITTNPKPARVAANIDPRIAELMDQERARLGRCSRATIIRMALADRYANADSSKQVA